MTVAATLLDGRYSYSLDAEIGAGGFCEVWRAADTVLTRPIAVKLLHAGYAHQPEARARFKAEARHAGAVSHENMRLWKTELAAFAAEAAARARRPYQPARTQPALYPAHDKEEPAMTGIYLDQDQADDLCELLGHVHTAAWWLLFASDQITGDLAQAAYPAHFHPRSAAFWLTEDLIHIGDRLHKAIHPDNDNSDQPGGTNRRNPAAQAGTSSTAPSRDGLDNSTPIGNHKPAMLPAVRPLPQAN